MILIRRARDRGRLLERRPEMLAAGESDRAAEGDTSREPEELVEGQCGCGSGSEISAGRPCLR